MATNKLDWKDEEEAARQMAGNWRRFAAFVWGRGYRLNDADQWMIGYTSHRGAGLLAQSNHQVITERLVFFSEGADPDLVFERHFHFAFGHIEGFSIRVYGVDGTVTDAFRAFCLIQKQREDSTILDASDYNRREYEATLADHLGAALLHLYAEKAAGGADLQNPLAAQIDPAQIGIDVRPEISLSLDRPISGKVHRVVEIALFETGHHTRAHEYRVIPRQRIDRRIVHREHTSSIP